MSDTNITLDKLPVGHSATILSLGTPDSEKGSAAQNSQVGSLRQHLLDMGLIPGQVVTLTNSPLWAIRFRFRSEATV